MSKKISKTEYTEPYPIPSRQDAMQAVKTLIAWAGDNPNREGLIDTPKRVVDEPYERFDKGTKRGDYYIRLFNSWLDATKKHHNELTI